MNPINLLKKNKTTIGEYFHITFGVALYCIGVTFFLLPYKLTTGGVAGIGSIIYYATGFAVENTYLLINVFLLVLAVIELGWKFCFKTIYAVLAITLFLWGTQRIYELIGSPMLAGEELFMSSLIGAIMEGAGLGLCFMSGGSTGGTDIIASIINKHRNMSLGTVMIVLDVMIISSCYFVFYDLQRVIFGYVILVVSSFTLDFIISHYRQAVEFKIYSRNPKAIAEAIIKSGSGVTILEGEGYYTHSERKVIVSVVRKKEQVIMLKMIKSIDPFAFVTMGNVSGVWGEGFDAIKVREKKKTLARKVIVLATDNQDEIEEVQIMFGNSYEIRSLNGIGCNISNPVNSDIQSNNAILKARFIKKYYGFDCIAQGNTLNENTKNIYAIATGDAIAEECIINKVETYEEAKAFFEAEKKQTKKQALKNVRS